MHLAVGGVQIGGYVRGLTPSAHAAFRVSGPSLAGRCLGRSTERCRQYRRGGEPGRLPVRELERLGMGPSVVLRQRFTESTGAAGDGALADSQRVTGAG